MNLVTQGVFRSDPFVSCGLLSKYDFTSPFRPLFEKLLVIKLIVDILNGHTGVVQVKDVIPSFGNGYNDGLSRICNTKIA